MTARITPCPARTDVVGESLHRGTLKEETTYARVQCSVCHALVVVPSGDLPRLAGTGDHVALSCSVCRVVDAMARITCRRITEDTEAIPF